MVAYSFKKRFAVPIRLGLGIITPTSAPGIFSKRQTIRALGKRRHAVPGDILQLYTGMRTRQCEKIGDGRCVGAVPISLHFGSSPWVGYGNVSITSGIALDVFARRDGFDGWLSMAEFWAEEHPGVRDFRGMLIEWEPLT